MRSLVPRVVLKNFFLYFARLVRFITSQISFSSSLLVLLFFFHRSGQPVVEVSCILAHANIVYTVVPKSVVHSDAWPREKNLRVLRRRTQWGTVPPSRGAV